MTYQELLESPNWLQKRIDILNRDKRICQNCSNAKINKFIKRYAKLNRRSTNSKRVIYETLEKEEVSISISSFKSYNLIVKNLILYFTKSEENYIIPIAARRLMHNEVNGIESDLLTQEWIFVNNLHIHHKYYVKGKRPWEYDNDALTTLCWHCHEELHKKVLIPVYSGEKIFGYVTPCSRCHGAGYFPDYNHVQNGICFRCIGAKYEELIIR